MKISLYSSICAIVLSSVILTIVCMIRKRYRLSKLVDIKLFVFGYILGFVRLVLPIDFSFTTGVQIAGCFAIGWDYLLYKNFSVFSISFTIGELIVVVASIIAIMRLLEFVIVYVKEMRCWNKCEILNVRQIMSEVSSKMCFVTNCLVVKCPELEMPSVTGVFNGKILLPEKEYTDSELFYILMHELTHIRRKDMLKKLGVELFRCIFWWIPFSSFITKDFEQAMEIGCDRDVTKNLSKSEKIMYMQMLIDSLRKTSEIKKLTRISMKFALQENHNSMKERFRLMTTTDDAQRNKMILVVLSGIFVFMISYIAAPIPNIQPTGEEMVNEEGYVITANSTYLIYENGKYFLVTHNNDYFEVSEEHAKNLMVTGISVKDGQNE